MNNLQLQSLNYLKTLLDEIKEISQSNTDFHPEKWEKYSELKKELIPTTINVLFNYENCLAIEIIKEGIIVMYRNLRNVFPYENFELFNSEDILSSQKYLINDMKELINDFNRDKEDNIRKINILKAELYILKETDEAFKKNNELELKVLKEEWEEIKTIMNHMDYLKAKDAIQYEAYTREVRKKDCNNAIERYEDNINLYNTNIKKLEDLINLLSKRMLETFEERTELKVKSEETKKKKNKI